MQCGRRPSFNMGKAAVVREASEESTVQVRRGIGDGMFVSGGSWQHGKFQQVGELFDQLVLREEQTGPDGMAERPV